MATKLSDLPIGVPVPHTSDPGTAFPDVGLSLRIDEDNTLYMGEISNARYEDAGPEAAHLGTSGGWWIVHYGKNETTVIAKCVDHNVGHAIFDIIGAALRGK